MTRPRNDLRMHLGFATELPNALGNSVCVLLLFLGMDTEFRRHCSRMKACGHEVMKLVAQHTHELSRECLVQNAHGLVQVQPVVLGHGAIFDLLACPGSNFFNVFQEMHRVFLYIVAKTGYRPLHEGLEGQYPVCCTRYNRRGTAGMPTLRHTDSSSPYLSGVLSPGEKQKLFHKRALPND